MKHYRFSLLLVALFVQNIYSLDVLKNGSFGVISNQSFNQSWLSPKNTTFSFYRIYPDCVKGQTQKTCMQDVDWQNEMRGFTFNRKPIVFETLQDSSNIKTITFTPLLKLQRDAEDNLQLKLEFNTTDQTVVISTYDTSVGEKKKSSWKLSLKPFQKKLKNLANMPGAKPWLDAMVKAKAIPSVWQILVPVLPTVWYLNFTIDFQNKISDISIDLGIPWGIGENKKIILLPIAQEQLQTTFKALQELSVY